MEERFDAGQARRLLKKAEEMAGSQDVEIDVDGSVASSGPDGSVESQEIWCFVENVETGFRSFSVSASAL